MSKKHTGGLGEIHAHQSMEINHAKIQGCAISVKKCKDHIVWGVPECLLQSEEQFQLSHPTSKKQAWSGPGGMEAVYKRIVLQCWDHVPGA